MGQPRVWEPYAAAFAVEGRPVSGVAVAAGVRRSILNPVTGLLAASAEANGEWSDDRFMPGLRVGVGMPAIGLGIGADWRSSSGNVATVLTFETAIRRGGLLGGGSMLRLDWTPTRAHEVALGVRLPVAQPYAGRTRPHTSHVHLGNRKFTVPAPPPSVALAMMTIARTAALIRAYGSLYFDADRAALDDGARQESMRSYARVLATYHGAISAVFRAAAGDSVLGERVATRARTTLFDDVIAPYDALFGQAKEPSNIDALAGAASDRFGRWLADATDLGPEARAATAHVFAQWLGVVRDVHHESLRLWKDSRVVWLPPQLALAPDQIDDQAEVDALVARMAGHPFTDDNALAYLRTADLPLEIARSILAARRYHVLWTHDFTGRRENGALDDVAYTMVADAYLPALTQAVARYDSTGTMPVFLLLLDAYYYHERDSKIWMNLLEDPLVAEPRLRPNEATQAAHLHERLVALRTAVAQSRRLQREASSRGGERWLRKVVKINVSIVQPSDFSFRSIRIVPPLPFVADNVMRDHRKIVVYDCTEARPDDGALIVAGTGIGEHYASVTWEDRGYRVRGSAALEARAAVRRALTTNGLRDDQIPEPLRPVAPRESSTDQRIARRDVARVLHVQNEAGFGTKSVSAARAMLYSLAPPGSVIIAPDGLWLSETWAAMLAGAAARGSTVAIIAPAAANAPSPEAPILVIERELLRRLLSLRDYIARRDGSHGSTLRVGLYAVRAPATDIAGRVAEVRAGLRRAPWILEVVPFDARVLGVLDRAMEAASATDASRPALGQDEAPRAPQFHQKTQLIARPGAIAALLRLPGWEDALARAIRMQARETIRLADAIGKSRRVSDSSAIAATDASMDGYERALTPDERRGIGLYFMAGTENHDPRGLMLDGEASVIVSGFQASVGLVDLFYLMARTTWVRSAAEIDTFLPPPRGLFARAARWLRDVL